MWALAWLLKGIVQHHHWSLHLCAEGMEDSVKAQYAFFKFLILCQVIK